MKKYKLTSTTINFCGKTLYQIKALKDFGDVKKGDLGGYIEKEENLSQEGKAWVYDNGKVYDEAEVKESAKIRNNAEVFGTSEICEGVEIGGNVKICDAYILGDAKIY